ncbi:hypothetical protein Tel_10180 [Candidatus Tenderia electrophaga]|jgi:hypothetical protein|uniref:DUF4168 domain-containing protein n=1 Tax=Candidatus Tenderia electrophaga TaxID=1748243 RepID=A0A0S2TEC0_9GAMM|nr:hypothetical protein Tel_10180 [Candidatus Tenderia electrophaga]
MNTKTGLSFALLLSAALILPFAAVAGDEATSKMARIVADINHRPSATDKEKLRQIAEKGSPAQQAIANALLDMNHKVSPSAKDRLGKIAQDSSVPEDTRELASIVKEFHHEASSAAKQKLRDM